MPAGEEQCECDDAPHHDDIMNPAVERPVFSEAAEMGE